MQELAKGLEGWVGADHTGGLVTCLCSHCPVATGGTFVSSSPFYALPLLPLPSRARAATITAVCANMCCLLSVMLQPYMPAVSRELQQQLQVSLRVHSNEMTIILPLSAKHGVSYQCLLQLLLLYMDTCKCNSWGVVLTSAPYGVIGVIGVCNSHCYFTHVLHVCHHDCDCVVVILLVYRARQGPSHFDMTHIRKGVKRCLYVCLVLYKQG